MSAHAYCSARFCQSKVPKNRSPEGCLNEGPLRRFSTRVRTVSIVPPSSHSVVMPMNRRCSAQSSGMSRDSSLSGSSPVGAVPCNTAF